MYADRFLAAHKLQRGPIKLFGDQYGLIQTCVAVSNSAPENGLEGEMIRFMNISADERWFNLTKAEEASKSDKQAIVIPAHLRPKMKKIRYLFLPKNHRLIFICSKGEDKMSPGLAQTLLREFLNHPDLVKEGGSAEVTVEQSRNALKELLEMYSLRHLTISFTRPNADEGNEGEAAILKEMEDQNISRLQSIYDAGPGESLKPDQRNIAMTRVAVSNGYVEGRGRDSEGNVKIVNTSDKPLVKAFRERLDKLNVIEWLRTKGQEMIQLLSLPNEPK
jgi:hypothetical protein